MTTHRFDVFGRQILVERTGGRWVPFYPGADGKRRPRISSFRIFSKPTNSANISAICSTKAQRRITATSSAWTCPSRTERRRARHGRHQPRRLPPALAGTRETRQAPCRASARRRHTRPAPQLLPVPARRLVALLLGIE